MRQVETLSENVDLVLDFQQKQQKKREAKRLEKMRKQAQRIDKFVQATEGFSAEPDNSDV